MKFTWRWAVWCLRILSTERCDRGNIHVRNLSTDWLASDKAGTRRLGGGGAAWVWDLCTHSWALRLCMSWPQRGAVLLGTDSLPGPLPSGLKTNKAEIMLLRWWWWWWWAAIKIIMRNCDPGEQLWVSTSSVFTVSMRLSWYRMGSPSWQLSGLRAVFTTVSQMS